MKLAESTPKCTKRCVIGILNLCWADAFLQGVIATFQTKKQNIHWERQDNAGRDKNVHLFSERRKSAV